MPIEHGASGRNKLCTAKGSMVGLIDGEEYEGWDLRTGFKPSKM